ncbi:MAG: phosphoribosylglycinamide formyltransferase [Chitinophagales bacterium]|nr:phosphoribosylglycinamide formyltransferase [Bacteroidota bacterium]MCB9042184.1 phosphoribosylglycinamide formyltransferase [Chitinophagales bacterium]
MPRIAIFASGNGSNAENLFHYFSQHKIAEISLIICNNLQAGILARAQNLGIPVLLIHKNSLYQQNVVENWLISLKIDWIVLAGFLWKIPEKLIALYPKKIVNIHPSLLPKYGGKGMYGMRVHEAVIAAGETESGISIHFVNEAYDEGAIIFQARCPIEMDETADSLARKIHQLEYEHFPKVLASLF